MWAFETRSSTDHFDALPSQFPKISHLCKNRTGLNVAPPPFLHFLETSFEVLPYFLHPFCAAAMPAVPEYGAGKDRAYLDLKCTNAIRKSHYQRV